MGRPPKTEQGRSTALERRKKLRAELITRLDNKDYITLSEAIILQREILGLTQAALAKRAGVSTGTIKALEAEKGNPTLKAAQKVLSTLGDLGLYVGRRQVMSGTFTSTRSE